MTRAVQESRNRILRRLPADEQQALAGVAEDVDLLPGDVVCGAGRRVEHVYFPRRGVISLFAVAAKAPNVGVGLIGAHGMFGLAVAAGAPRSQLLAVCQGPVAAQRIDSVSFLRELQRCPSLRSALFAYSHELCAQLACNAACIAQHPSQMRLARWMLEMTHQQGLAGGLSSTQSAMAGALGIRRAAVNTAASALQRMGLIRYVRGKVTIVDRVGLAAAACSCRSRL